MDTGTVLAIVIPLLVVLAGIVLFTTARRRDAANVGRLSGETRRRDSGAEAPGRSEEGREVERSAELARRGAELEPVVEAELEPWSPPDPEAIGVSRRQFLNRSMVGLTVFSSSAFGATVLAFLWPPEGEGFGSVVNIGSVTDVEDAIEGSQPAAGFSYFPQARAYVQRYPAETLDAARSVYADSIVSGMEEGYVALYQKCPHLGCKVPECATSQWFECPCHGSQYNRVGEKRGGPAPRGMDRFPISIENGQMFIDTGTVVQGPAIGTNTTGQAAEGPHCLADGGGH